LYTNRLAVVVRLNVPLSEKLVISLAKKSVVAVGALLLLFIYLFWHFANVQFLKQTSLYFSVCSVELQKFLV